MSQVSSNRPRESVETPAPSSARSAPENVSRPGWPEIVVGLVVFAAVGFGGGSLIFALAHGINEVFPATVVTGLIAAGVFRRSGSFWPAVIVHAVVNLPTIPAMVLAGTG